MLKLHYDTDPVLRQVAQSVTAYDEDLNTLATQMLAIMDLYNGIGLAAPQVGISKRVIVVNFEPYILVNPIWHPKTNQEQKGREGCLSFPKLWLDITRYHAIRVEYFTVDGAGKFWADLTGIQARVVQHEVDHLDGKVFTTKVNSVALAMAKKRK